MLARDLKAGERVIYNHHPHINGVILEVRSPNSDFEVTEARVRWFRTGHNVPQWLSAEDLSWHRSFTIEEERLPGERLITQFLVTEGDPKRMSREDAERHYKNQHPDEDLRFHYGHLEFDRRRVTPEVWAMKITGAKAVRPNVTGGAVFGKPKKKER